MTYKYSIARYLKNFDIFLRNIFGRWIGYWEIKIADSCCALELVYSSLMFMLVGFIALIIWFGRYDS